MFIRFWIEIENTTVNEIAIAFLGTMLTVELIEFCLRSIQFFGIAIRYKSDVHNIQNGLISIPNLRRDEALAIGTKSFVIDR